MPNNKTPRKINSIFILTDLESIAGVERFIQTREQGPEREKARELLTEEVNAVIKGINSYDSEIKIHVWDGHGNGGIIEENLLNIYNFIPHQRTHLYNYFKENSIDSLLFVGQHAQAQTYHGNQCHTMSSRFTKYFKLNEKFIGEFGLRAAIAGELNIPTIYIAGDDKACVEAKNLIPDIVCTTVMYGTGWESALSLNVDEVHRREVYDVQLALKLASEGYIEPLIVKPPIQLEVCRKNFLHAQRYFSKGGKRKGMKTAIFEVDSLKELQDKKVL
jgi:D-amino peptidase